MSLYASVPLANTILDYSFARNEPMLRRKLDAIIYFTASEYLKNTGALLFAERFIAEACGPTLLNIGFKFDCFKDKPIDKYAKDAVGEAYKIPLDTDAHVAGAFEPVWWATKNMDATRLWDLTRAEGSAWHSARRHGRDTLPWEAVETDRTYRAALGLGTRIPVLRP